jgi:cellulose synthase/poly-beta-1,6-N-acetylglucosamine synthase-like glycosyltransferase
MANESKEKIIAKINNTSQLDYPIDLEVIIALDNPTPETMNTIEEETTVLWKVARSFEPRGKEVMQEAAVSLAYSKSQFFVFTDVTTMLQPDALQKLIRNFADPSVGAVDGESKIVTKDGKFSSEGLYLRYENKIRDLESRTSSLVTTGGCLFAARRNVVKQIFSRPTQSDFGAALASTTLGLKTVLEKEAIAMVPDLKDPSKEFSRKRRTILRGMNSLWQYRELLNPKKGWFALQLWSHKVLKWMVPLFLIAAYISNIYLISPFNAWYLSLLTLQNAFYGMAITGIISDDFLKLLKIPTFFVSSNVACLMAMVDFLLGREARIWKESVR